MIVCIKVPGTQATECSEGVLSYTCCTEHLLSNSRVKWCYKTVYRLHDLRKYDVVKDLVIALSKNLCEVTHLHNITCTSASLSVCPSIIVIVFNCRHSMELDAPGCLQWLVASCSYI